LVWCLFLSLFLCLLLLGCRLAAIGLGSNATVLLGGSLVCVVHCSSQFLINEMPAKKFLIMISERTMRCVAQDFSCTPSC